MLNKIKCNGKVVSVDTKTCVGGDGQLRVPATLLMFKGPILLIGSNAG
jgi:hypothetical protein